VSHAQGATSLRCRDSEKGGAVVKADKTKQHELEERRLRKAIWRNMTGCACPNVIEWIPTRADERCSKSWVRCNERLRRIHAECESRGIVPVLPLEMAAKS
jgi:hypothetical protein